MCGIFTENKERKNKLEMKIKATIYVSGNSLLVQSLDCKEVEPVHSKGDQFWVFIGRTDAKAETPILWPPDGKS